MSRLHRIFPFLNWPRPDAALLRSEALAGLTVGLMVIPQGVAYAALAGMPLVTGIYASMLPALVAVLFSASVRLSVGPTALTCLLVSASLTGLAEPGSARWIELAVWLALTLALLNASTSMWTPATASVQRPVLAVMYMPSTSTTYTTPRLTRSACVPRHRPWGVMTVACVFAR